MSAEGEEVVSLFRFATCATLLLKRGSLSHPLIPLFLALLQLLCIDAHMYIYFTFDANILAIALLQHQKN